MATVSGERYSSDVSIRLLIGGQTLRVAQVGPNRLILRDQVDAPATEAQLEITVDGRSSIRTVMLPHGLKSGSDVALYF